MELPVLLELLFVQIEVFVHHLFAILTRRHGIGLLEDCRKIRFRGKSAQFRDETRRMAAGQQQDLCAIQTQARQTSQGRFFLRLFENRVKIYRRQMHCGGKIVQRAWLRKVFFHVGDGSHGDVHSLVNAGRRASANALFFLER